MLLFSKLLQSKRMPTTDAKRRRLRLESLENRKLLAGDVLPLATESVDASVATSDDVAVQTRSSDHSSDSCRAPDDTGRVDMGIVESDDAASVRRFVGSGRGRGRESVDSLGVKFGSIGANTEMAAVNVDLQGVDTGNIDAWIDFDSDLQWEPDEQILANADVIGGLQTLNFDVPDTAAAGTVMARFLVSSVDDSSSREVATRGEFQHFEVTILPAVPEVQSVMINDGHPSRSKVTSLSVTFDSEVDHTALQSAFVVTNVTNDLTVGQVDVSATDEEGKTTAVLTFSGASTVTPSEGSLGTSLIDGNYKLEILSDDVSLASNGDATMSTDYQFGGHTIADAENDDFFVWYGDHDGDGDTDFTDFDSGFRPSFGSVMGDGAYNELLDANSDGVINYTDFVQVFLQKIGSTRP